MLSDEIVERLLQRERESTAVVSSAEDSPADPNPDQESDPDPQLRKAIEAVVASSDVNVALQ